MSCDADWIYLLKFSIFNTLQIDYFSGLLLSIQKAFTKWEEGPGCFAPQTLRELGQYPIDLKWVWHPIFRYIKCIQKRKKVCFLLCLILSDLGSIHCTPALCHISQLLLIFKTVWLRVRKQKQSRHKDSVYSLPVGLYCVVFSCGPYI